MSLLKTWQPTPKPAGRVKSTEGYRSCLCQFTTSSLEELDVQSRLCTSLASSMLAATECPLAIRVGDSGMHDDESVRPDSHINTPLHRPRLLLSVMAIGSMLSCVSLCSE